jgi:hypothetical protein
MINLLTLEPAEAERIAYAEGFTMAAELLKRIDELTRERDELAAEVENLKDPAAEVETLEMWENDNGPADEYKEFFEDCFKRLAGHYPCPSITSDYDKSVIFEAIEKGVDE